MTMWTKNPKKERETENEAKKKAGDQGSFDPMECDGLMVVKAEEWKEYVSRCRRGGGNKAPGFTGQGK